MYIPAQIELVGTLVENTDYRKEEQHLNSRWNTRHLLSIGLN